MGRRASTRWWPRRSPTAAGDRHDRSRQHVRHARVLQGVQQAGDQADHRHRGLHGPRSPQRAPDAARPDRRLRRRHRGRQEALLPPHVAGRERGRVPQPDPAQQPGVPRGLLLQAADRLGAAREVLRRTDRHHRLPRRARAAIAAARRHEGGDRQGRPGCRRSSARTTCSSSSRTTGSRRSATPTRSWSRSPSRSALRCSPPTTRTTPTAKTTRVTTPCCASRPAL